MNRRELLGAGAALGLMTATKGGAATTSKGLLHTIPVEEACLPPDVAELWERVLGTIPYKRDLLLDVHGRRLEKMDRFRIERSILSLTVPGPQGCADPTVAKEMATRGNDALAKIVAQRPDRFSGLGTAAMHDVDVACRELERVVKDLGMCGVLLNNFQRAGTNGEVLFYDLPQYDTFWETAQSLDVPVYLHPGLIPQAGGRMQDLQGFNWLHDAAWSFATSTGLHALRIITSGVFDRFPRAKLVLGHNGEHIVADLWRIDNRLKKQPAGYEGKRTVRAYFQRNVWVTTSGEFSNPGLRHVTEEIGADRVMFAIDYPYESMEEGTTWFAQAPLSEQEREMIGRGTAIEVFKLPS